MQSLHQLSSLCIKRNHGLRAAVLFLPTSLFNLSDIMELILLQILLFNYKDSLWRPYSLSTTYLWYFHAPLTRSSDARGDATQTGGSSLKLATIVTELSTAMKQFYIYITMRDEVELFKSCVWIEKMAGAIAPDEKTFW